METPPMPKGLLKYFVTLLAALGCFAVGVAVDSLLLHSDATAVTPQVSCLRAPGTLTKPLLSCVLPRAGKEFSALEEGVQSYIDGRIGERKAARVSVYFGDLVGGTSFSVNENEAYSPASLLKLPDMMALYRMADSDPTVTGKALVFHTASDSGTPAYPPAETLIPGNAYSVDELVSRMIRYSDNESMFLLRSAWDSSRFAGPFTDLGLAVPDDAVVNDTFRVADYARFFRVLFDATYLSRQSSEKALTLLTQTTFKNGLVAGVPPGTKVAHKFGERAYLNEATKELHDCGIVYRPKSPYILCVMTEGTDYPALGGVIRGISKLTWEYMAKPTSEIQPQ